MIKNNFQLNRQQAYSSLLIYVDKENNLPLLTKVGKLKHDPLDFKNWTDPQYGQTITIEKPGSNSIIKSPSKKFKPLITDLLIDSYPKHWLFKSYCAIYNSNTNFYCFFDDDNQFVRCSQYENKKWHNQSILSLNLKSISSVLQTLRANKTCVQHWTFCESNKFEERFLNKRSSLF